VPERFSEDELTVKVDWPDTVVLFDAVTGEAEVLDRLPEIDGAVYEYGAGMYGTDTYGTGV